MKYVLVLDVAKGKSMFMLSSDIGEILLEPTEFVHNKNSFELIDSNINKLNIKILIVFFIIFSSLFFNARPFLYIIIIS